MGFDIFDDLIFPYFSKLKQDFWSSSSFHTSSATVLGLSADKAATGMAERVILY